MESSVKKLKTFQMQLPPILWPLLCGSGEDPNICEGCEAFVRLDTWGLQNLKFTEFRKQVMWMTLCVFLYNNYIIAVTFFLSRINFSNCFYN